MTKANTVAIGKAVLFADKAVVFPADGPWNDVLRDRRNVTTLPAFADIPTAGQRIHAGSPILTIFASGSSADDCYVQLKRQAAEVERWLR
jgi:predicted ATP-grasp superfamily ATP-dependent carboligase